MPPLHPALLHCAQAYAKAGVSPTPFLVRASTADKTGFKATPLTEFNHRLRALLAEFSTPEGETTHSLRRGPAQHAHAQLGQSAAAVGARLQHREPGGPQTQVYLDASRETGRPQRDRSKRARR